MRFPQPIAEFIVWTQKPEQHGATWKVVGDFDRARGWRVKWICNSRTLDLDATDARKLSRYFKQQFTITFRDTPADKRDHAKEAQVFEWIDQLDRLGKACLQNRRQGLVPQQMGKTAEQLIAEAIAPAKVVTA